MTTIKEYWPVGSETRTGGETVAILGEGFEGVTNVTFGPFAAHFTLNSDTEIIATAPPFAEGHGTEDGLVRLWTAEGAVAATDAEWTWAGSTLAALAELDALLDAATDRSAIDMSDRDELDRVLDPQPPVVVNWEPRGSASVAGGETVRIFGHEFTGATEVRFGPYRAHFNVLDDAHIDATAPAFDEALVLHSAYVRVFNANGGSDFDGQPEWTWGGQTMAQLSPNVVDETTPLTVTHTAPEFSAGVEGGDEIHVFGSGFAAGVTKVTFGPLEATHVGVISDTELIATPPRFVDQDLEGDAPRCVRVWRGDLVSPSVIDRDRYPSWTNWTWGGRLFRSPDRLGNAPYPDRFEITSVTPTGSATRAGGDQVVVTGVGLQSVEWVTIAGIEIVDFTVESDERLVTTAPRYSRDAVGTNGVVLGGPGNMRAESQYQWTWDGKTAADLRGH